MVRAVSWQMEKMSHTSEKSKSETIWDKVDRDKYRQLINKQGQAYPKEQSWTYTQQGWWPSKNDERWRANAAVSLNRYEIMQMRLIQVDDYEKSLSKWQKFAFDAFSYFEPVKTT